MPDLVPPAEFVVDVLGAADVAALRDFTALCGDVFDDPAAYASAPPDDEYLRDLLARDTVIAIVARAGDRVIGGLFAYVLPKFEQRRSETYLYDLAVAAAWRRRGVATALVRRLTVEAADHDSWVVYVQADDGDEPALALYRGMGEPENVWHFDIGHPS